MSVVSASRRTKRAGLAGFGSGGKCRVACTIVLVRWIRGGWKQDLLAPAPGARIEADGDSAPQAEREGKEGKPGG